MFANKLIFVLFLPFLVVCFTIYPTRTSAGEPDPTDECQNYQANVKAYKICKIMQTYGQVNAKQLSAKYWELLSLGIQKEGTAKAILSLEYHGDNYYMYNGSYSMDPDEFTRQISYLCKNNYHFVTGPELVGFVEGWLALPKKSVILTTDSGRQSLASIPRMTTALERIEKEYDCSPHLISFIWTQMMDSDETVTCKEDICWKTFRAAADSGFFTFGTHSESHSNFLVKNDVNFLRMDLNQSILEISFNLGLRPYLLSWPHEACLVNSQTLNNLGIKAAFGGRSYPIRDNYVHVIDPQKYCLSRDFPPNPVSFSARPNGYSLEEMLNEAANIKLNN
jgi:hypothetical protein